MSENEAFSVNEFCLAYRISRTTLYKLWNSGEGPRAMKVGAKTLISRVSAEEWRSEREAAFNTSEVVA